MTNKDLVEVFNAIAIASGDIPDDKKNDIVYLQDVLTTVKFYATSAIAKLNSETPE